MINNVSEDETKRDLASDSRPVRDWYAQAMAGMYSQH